MQLPLPFLIGAADAAPAVPPEPAEGTSLPERTNTPVDDRFRDRVPGPGIVFVRHATARRYILRVRPDGTLRVTIPRRGSKREAEAFVRRQSAWVERERARVRETHGPREWGDGREMLLDGAVVRVTVNGGDTPSVEYGSRRVTLRPDESIRRAIERDLILLARRTLEPRLRALAAEHGLDAKRVTIRNQRSRWGSCARNGNIALNFRLVQMPASVRDYVLVHELMHLKQQNHSRRFWRLVEAACPDFRTAERWLRVEGRSLF